MLGASRSARNRESIGRLVPKIALMGTLKFDWSNNLLPYETVMVKEQGWDQDGRMWVTPMHDIKLNVEFRSNTELIDLPKANMEPQNLKDACKVALCERNVKVGIVPNEIKGVLEDTIRIKKERKMKKRIRKAKEEAEKYMKGQRKKKECYDYEKKFKGFKLSTLLYGGKMRAIFNNNGEFTLLEKELVRTALIKARTYLKYMPDTKLNCNVIFARYAIASLVGMKEKIVDNGLRPLPDLVE